MALLHKIPLRTAWYGLIILASVLPAIALSPWLGQQAHQLLLESAIQKEELFHTQMETRLASETERLISVMVNKSDSMAHILSNTQELPLLSSLINKIIERESTIATVTIYDTTANIIRRCHHETHTHVSITTDSPAFAVPIHGRTFIGSPARLSDGHFEFIISVPVIANNQSVGVLVATVSVDQLWDTIRARLPKHDSKIYLLDSRGSLLVNRSNSDHQQGDLLSDKAIVRTLLSGNNWNRPEVYQGFEKNEVFGIGSLVPILKWGIISEVPSSAIMGPIIDALIGLTLIIFMLHILFGLLSLLFTRFLLSPISDLAKAVKSAASGDYTRHAQPSRYSEIDDLTASFNTMVDEIDRRENSLQKFSKAIEYAGEAIIVANRRGLIEYANPAFSRITGYPLEEVIGKSPVSFSGDNENRKPYKELLRSIFRGEIWEGSLIGRKKSGECYPSMISVAPIYSGNKITHFVSIQQDMSDQLMLEEQLRQSQKMEALGTLVGGIAHDFNNMLAGITGNLYLAKRKAADLPDVVEKIITAEILGYRAGDMIAQLLAFARKGTVQMISLPLSTFLNEAVKLSAASIPENIAIVTDIASHTPLSVNGDSTQIQQMLMNMISNAIDAVENEEKPEIRISLEKYEANDTFRMAHPHMESDRFAMLTVHDNGHGISTDLLENIFEPFFTTKPEGKGSGLGLSMIYGAMQTHGGIVDVKSSTNSGTAFHLYFPLINADDEDRTSEVIATEQPGSGETILLVDDEETVCEAGREVLKSLGYNVLVATDGAEGLAQFNSHQHEIALVLSDVVMPNMNGMEMAKEIRAINKNVPFIFVTGYDKELFAKKALQHNDVLLSKPLSIPKLSRSIQSLLKGK